MHWILFCVDVQYDKIPSDQLYSALMRLDLLEEALQILRKYDSKQTSPGS